LFVILHKTGCQSILIIFNKTWGIANYWGTMVLIYFLFLTAGSKSANIKSVNPVQPAEENNVLSGDASRMFIRDNQESGKNTLSNLPQKNLLYFRAGFGTTIFPFALFLLAGMALQYFLSQKRNKNQHQNKDDNPSEKTVPTASGSQEEMDVSRFKSFIDNIHCPVQFVNYSGKFVYVNLAWCK
jgi:hypothetical protein